MTLRCTIAMPEDAALVYRIMREAFAVYEGALNPPSGANRETVEDVQQDMAKGGALLVWDGETPVASARFEIEDDHLYVRRVAVLPGFQKQGVGALLMRSIEAFACPFNRREIQVVVRMSLPGNVAFYQKLGYEILRTEMHPKAHDRVAFMAKRLTCEAGDDLSLDDRLRLGRALSRTGQDERAMVYLKTLDTQFPDDARVQYELACAHDRAGLEAEAAPYYQRALALGLVGDDLSRAYLGLGSTLRNLGKYEESIRVLSEGRARFPEYTALRPFLALSLFDAGQHQEALVEMLELTLDHPNTPDIAAYSRALRYYTDQLKCKHD
jgi:ribosomal protein S18 acetylase RimI-like enzyme